MLKTTLVRLCFCAASQVSSYCQQMYNRPYRQHGAQEKTLLAFQALLNAALHAVTSADADININSATDPLPAASLPENAARDVPAAGSAGGSGGGSCLASSVLDMVISCREEFSSYSHAAAKGCWQLNSASAAAAAPDAIDAAAWATLECGKVALQCIGTALRLSLSVQSR